jgi:uncharacterized protein YprB with RNaseH-like and TPR domain
VLARTFLFLPGIGPVREARLWRRGVDSWGAYRAIPRIPGIRPRLKERHDELLRIAESSARDPAFVARLLPAAEHWRAYAAFAESAAFIDIETTGDRTNALTVVGVRRLSQSRAFVRGKDYSPEAVSSFLEGATCLVTFNGATFDLPVLAANGVRLPPVPHVDLRPVFTRLGYAGGLKRIEETLGLARSDGVRGLSGYDAVKLWRRWEGRGDEEALRTLVAYNVADFENLEPLARFACEKLESQLLREPLQTRLLPGAFGTAAGALTGRPASSGSLPAGP